MLKRRWIAHKTRNARKGFQMIATGVLRCQQEEQKIDRFAVVAVETDGFG